MPNATAIRVMPPTGASARNAASPVFVALFAATDGSPPSNRQRVGGNYTIPSKPIRIIKYDVFPCILMRLYSTSSLCTS